MENRFKLKLSRMFQKASLGTCRSRSLSDVIEKAVFLPQNYATDPPPPPPPRPFSSICRPKCSSDPNHQPINHSCLISRSNTDVMLPRRKIFERCSPFVKPETPNSMFSHSNPFYQVHESRSFRQRKKTTNKKKKKKATKSSELFAITSSSLESNHFYNGWWSSSEDEETDTLFSSNTHTSDSSGSRRRLCSTSRRKGHSFSRRRTSSEMGLMPLQGKVKDSFAVVKKSSDPYNDFRTSMVEMIVEKQIFSGKDLEHLLQCFLKLNSPHHHRVIIEVFTEIWEALFSNLGT
ncbi:hypothetical protein M0R45_003307 [Rubus argutus]|uniref:Transcription repressor n=1 Tax=Rubus argutus TaxID=59490 RepID=A0AAW1YEN1_RUBAR